MFGFFYRHERITYHITLTLKDKQTAKQSDFHEYIQTSVKDALSCTVLSVLGESLPLSPLLIVLCLPPLLPNHLYLHGHGKYR